MKFSIEWNSTWSHSSLVDYALQVSNLYTERNRFPFQGVFELPHFVVRYMDVHRFARLSGIRPKI